MKETMPNTVNIMDTLTDSELREELIAFMLNMVNITSGSTGMAFYDVHCVLKYGLFDDTESVYHLASTVQLAREGKRFTFTDKQNRVITIKPSVMLKAFKRAGKVRADANIEQMATLLDLNWPDSVPESIEPVDAAYAYDNAWDFGSCMAGEDYPLAYDAWDASQCYVIKSKSDKVVGRFIVWDAKNHKGESIRYVDRLYYDGTPKVKAFYKAWADKNADMVRPDMPCSSDDSRPFYVTVDTPSYGWPYMDTFKYCVPMHGTWELHTTWKPNSTLLNSTSGQGPAEFECCDRCGASVPDTVSVQTSQYDEETWCLDCACNYATDTYYGWVSDDNIVYLDSGYSVANWVDTVKCIDSGLLVPEYAATRLYDGRHTTHSTVWVNGSGYFRYDDIEKYLIVPVNGGGRRMIRDLLPNYADNPVALRAAYDSVTFRFELNDALNAINAALNIK